MSQPNRLSAGIDLSNYQRPQSPLELMRPVKKSCFYTLPAGFGFGAFVHWDGDRTTVHYEDSCPNCHAWTMPRLVSFHFWHRHGRPSFDILQLPTEATLKLYESQAVKQRENQPMMIQLRRIPEQARGKVVLMSVRTVKKTSVSECQYDRDDLRRFVARIFGEPEDCFFG